MRVKDESTSSEEINAAINAHKGLIEAYTSYRTVKIYVLLFPLSILIQR